MTWLHGRSVRRYFFFAPRYRLQAYVPCSSTISKVLQKNQVTGYLLLLRSPQDLPPSCRRNLVGLSWILHRSMLSATALVSAFRGFTAVHLRIYSSPSGIWEQPDWSAVPQHLFSLLYKKNLEFAFLHSSDITSIPHEFLEVSVMELLEIKFVVWTTGVKSCRYPSIAIFLHMCLRSTFVLLPTNPTYLPPPFRMLSARVWGQTRPQT